MSDPEKKRKKHRDGETDRERERQTDRQRHKQTISLICKDHI